MRAFFHTRLRSPTSTAACRENGDYLITRKCFVLSEPDAFELHRGRTSVTNQRVCFQSGVLYLHRQLIGYLIVRVNGD